MEKSIYKKQNSSIRHEKGYLSLSIILFVAIQFMVAAFQCYSVSQWFPAMWTLMTFDNFFITGTLIACGLAALCVPLLLVGLLLILAGKKVGRVLGLITLICSIVGNAVLIAAVAYNAVLTNTAIATIMFFYFIPAGVAFINGIAGCVYLLRAEGLKEYLSARRKRTPEPPKVRLPEERKEEEARKAGAGNSLVESTAVADAGEGQTALAMENADASSEESDEVEAVASTGTIDNPENSDAAEQDA